MEILSRRSEYLWLSVVSVRCSLFFTSMSQMAIVSLISACFWSSSSPSRRWYWLGSRPSLYRLVLICSCSQSGVLYVRIPELDGVVWEVFDHASAAVVFELGCPS